MDLKNTKNTYGVVAKAFHWVTALIILGLIVVGLYMADLPYSPQKLEIYALHKSFGLMVLWLVGLRLIWRTLNVKPAPHPQHTRSERILAALAHIFLYIAMIGMPLSGWLMSSAGEYPVPFFGLQMPDLMGKNPDAAKFLGGVHEVLAYLLILTIGLHALGAWKHHFIDRDSTLKRMMAGPLHKVGPYILIMILGLFTGGVVNYGLLSGKENAEPVKTEQQIEVTQSSSVLQADQWQIVRAESTLNFRASVYGKEFTGTFEGFDGKIIFDPENLESAQADIQINTGNIDSGDEERDSQMGSAEWFDNTSYQAAYFKSTDFQKTGENQYVAKGELTIKDHTVPVELQFTLKMTEDLENGRRRAFADGSVILNRLEFGLGEGSWASGDSIGLTVTVDLKLVADSALQVVLK